MSKSDPQFSSHRDTTLKMDVENMTFMLERLGQDCAPLQFIRELTQNAIEAIQSVPDKQGEIIWDVDWNHHTLTGIYKLAVIDTGVGMTGEEMLRYINKLSSSMHRQSKTGNYGIGAKIAAATRNKTGLIYLSWKDGIGYVSHLWRDADADIYGLREIQWPDGSIHYWAYVEDTVKPSSIKDHGTMVILLGDDVDANTMQPPTGTPAPSHWVLKYLNTRYFNFPEGITIKAREGWELGRGDSHNFLRTVTGQKQWLDQNGIANGSVRLSGATARWWVIKPDVDVHGRLAGGGHTAALYQDELYEMLTGRAAVTRLQSFGVIFGHNRVVIYLEPDKDTEQLTSNTARTNLLINGEPLPWAEWAAEFREKMPSEIQELMEEVSSGSSSSDHRQSIKERLKQIRELFRITRYRPVPRGNIGLDEESLTGGGIPRELGLTKKDESTSTPGGKGGRAGDIYGLFLSSRGIPGEEFRFDQDPEVTWVTAKEKTRTPPDMEDRAAKFLPQQNKLLINGDFRVYSDMVSRWCAKYSHAPGCKSVVEQTVREWFEQQLVEAVLGAQALRGSTQWTVGELEQIWSEEALTAVVLPRYHIDNNIKRTLGAKLGTLKEKERATTGSGKEVSATSEGDAK